MLELWGLSYSFFYFLLYLTSFLYHTYQVGKSVDLFYLPFIYFLYCVFYSYLDSLAITALLEFFLQAIILALSFPTG
jgi:hypothetical protein